MASESDEPAHADGSVGSPGSKGGLLIVLAVVSGVAAGIGGFTFRYAEGLSYFSKDPAACVNCHIMRPQYDAWLKASHHGVATCIDCHLPHELIPKYWAKAENGYRHSKEFTAETFAEPIVIQARGREILQANCVHCHAGTVHGNAAGTDERAEPSEQAALTCVHCHLSVGHGERAGLGGPLHYEIEAKRAAAELANTQSEE